MTDADPDPVHLGIFAEARTTYGWILPLGLGTLQQDVREEVDDALVRFGSFGQHFCIWFVPVPVHAAMNGNQRKRKPFQINQRKSNKVQPEYRRFHEI